MLVSAQRPNIESHNKVLQTDQNLLSCLSLAQKSRQQILATEERRSDAWAMSWVICVQYKSYDFTCYE